MLLLLILLPTFHAAPCSFAEEYSFRTTLTTNSLTSCELKELRSDDEIDYRMLHSFFNKRHYYPQRIETIEVTLGRNRRQHKVNMTETLDNYEDEDLLWEMTTRHSRLPDWARLPMSLLKSIQNEKKEEKIVRDGDEGEIDMKRHEKEELYKMIDQAIEDTTHVRDKITLSELKELTVAKFLLCKNSTIASDVDLLRELMPVYWYIKAVEGDFSFEFPPPQDDVMFEIFEFASEIEVTRKNLGKELHSSSGSAYEMFIESYKESLQAEIEFHNQVLRTIWTRNLGVYLNLTISYLLSSTGFF